MNNEVFTRVADFVGVRSDAMRAALHAVFVNGLSQSQVLERGAGVSQQSLSRAVGSFKRSVSQIADIAADLEITLTSLCIAYGGLHGGDVVVAEPADPAKGIYPATELAVLYCACYSSIPAYKMLNGQVVAMLASEGSLQEDADYTQLVTSDLGIHGSLQAAMRSRAKHSPDADRWDFIECADEIKALLAARRARGLYRF